MKPEHQALENSVPVSKWLSAVSKRETRSYEAEFYHLANCSDTGKHQSLCMLESKFMPKNRYTDILTYRHSRVELKPRESCDRSSFEFGGFDAEYDSYINANFIDVS